MSLKANGVTNYFTKDHLGSTNALTDASGNVISSAIYDSFGNSTGNLATRYQYTGREFDADTGLYYYRARFYDAKLGRFISEDPIGLSGGINQFGYVEGNPLNSTDPTGNFPTIILGRFTPVSLDEIQLYLAGFGLIPGLGEPADAIDGTICAFRGDYQGVALSGASLLPIGGIASGLTKISMRANKLLKGANVVTDGSRILKAADNVAVVKRIDLNPTHYPTKSQKGMQTLLDDIKANGIKEPISYVDDNGVKKIVDGHHRYYAARELGINNIPAKEVPLPFRGYKTYDDLILDSGKMPGYWKYLKK